MKRKSKPKQSAAVARDSGEGGFNCGFGSEIWNNSESDPAVLLDPSGVEVHRR